ncbi:MAG: hypothetical protein ACXQS5_06810, partial [Candidatus Methanospirareceae archaeon]
DSWTSDNNYTLKYIIAVEATDATLSNVTATMRIDDFTFTKDVVPLSVFQRPVNQQLELNYELSKGKTFYYSITNNTGSGITLYLVLVLELAE